MPASSQRRDDAPASSTLAKGLSSRHVQFIALGSAIGTGLFYGSSDAIQLAGPAVLLAYLAAGLAVFMVMRALGEMALRHTESGSFSRYARRYLGPAAGFVTGWMFVFEMLVVGIADVTALAVYLQKWWPNVPSWAWIAITIGALISLNLIHVKVFGETEFWLSIIKVLAIVAMILGGLAILIFGLGTPTHGDPTFKNLWNHDGFMPLGIGGVLLSLTVVMFAFGGVETLGISAAEAENPEQSVPRAINTIPWRILVFYVGAVGVIVCLAPWTVIDGKASPFVQIFDTLGLPAASNVLNAIVITASFSALNAGMYSIGRMLHGLAEQGDAPAALARTNSRGVPTTAILMVGASLVVGLVLNWLVPEGLFTLVASIATFATVFVWVMILLSHIAMKRQIARGAIEDGPFPVPAWPVASYATVMFMVGVVMLLAFSADTRPALYVGIVAGILMVGAQRLMARSTEN